MLPIGCAVAFYLASVDTLCVLVIAIGAVRYRARSSRLAPAILAASPNVRRLENPFYGHAALDWTKLAPDAACPTRGLNLAASRRSVSSTAPARPKRVSSIARWIPWRPQSNAPEGASATP